MSEITVPNSGSVITSASIEAAYETLRTQGNAILPADFQRQALGPQHFAKNNGGVIRARDFIDNVVSTTVTGTMTDESLADINTNWTLLSNYTLNNGGAGYTVTGPCWLVWWMNFRLQEWATVGEQDEMGFFAATYATSGGAEALAPLMPVGLHKQTQFVKSPATQEQAVSWWGAVDLTAKSGTWVFDYLKFYAARCECGTGVPTAPNFVVPHGTVGFLLVKA